MPSKDAEIIRELLKKISSAFKVNKLKIGADMISIHDILPDQNLKTEELDMGRYERIFSETENTLSNLLILEAYNLVELIEKNDDLYIKMTDLGVDYVKYILKTPRR